MLEKSKSQKAILRLNSARKVLAGLDDDGNATHPHQFSDDVISFADGEGMRRPFPEVLVSGVQALLETQITSLEKYFFLTRFKEFDQKIKQMFLEEGISEDIASNICISTGTSHLFNAFFNSLEMDNEVILTAPGYYHSLANWCHLNSGVLEIVQTKVENKYKICEEDLYNWVRSHGRIPKALVIFNPTYTGAIYTQEELEGIANFVKEFNVQVVEDSLFMYTKFDDSKHIYHLASHSSIKDNVINIHGASKTYGLANLRIGWACGGEEIINKMNFYVGATQVDAPHVSKVMALKALDGPISYLDANRKELFARSNLISNLIDNINSFVQTTHNRYNDGIIKISYMPEAGHSLLISFDNLLGLKTEYGFKLNNSIDITRYFLLKAKVALSPGYSMGFNDGTMRISFGCIGLKNSYDSSVEVEKFLILKEALQMNNLLSDLAEVSSYIETHEKDLLIGYRNKQEIAFSEGRKTIIIGMEKIKDAISYLLEYNHQEVKV
ncbi:MAG: aminotransferase class I/II-fold pyridoxal phosphate-dependent enzyme [Bacillota bacterium]|nr:aminotransferase class I/II-fold pyridoxal phosphate-dependent enzyme [Bacillota bacterium]